MVGSLVDHFLVLPDPRSHINKTRHKLVDILVMAICAIISGADDWVSIANYARLFAQAVRSHWSIENSLHWVLDVGFREDDSRTRKDHGPHNLAILRHIALNLLRNDKTKLGIKNKRLKAGWDNTYLTELLFDH